MARGGYGRHKVHLGPPCPTLLHPAGGPPQKRPNGRFRGGPPARQAACACLLPPWISHAKRLWCSKMVEHLSGAVWSRNSWRACAAVRRATVCRGVGVRGVWGVRGGQQGSGGCSKASLRSAKPCHFMQTPSQPNSQHGMAVHRANFDMISKFRIRNFVSVVFHGVANLKHHGNEFRSTLTLAN
jgi:hypothetical protein